MMVYNIAQITKTIIKTAGKMKDATYYAPFVLHKTDYIYVPLLNVTTRGKLDAQPICVGHVKQCGSTVFVSAKHLYDPKDECNLSFEIVMDSKDSITFTELCLL